jgi:hypothetical protein
MAMKSGDHGEESEPAFRHFGLQDHWQARAAREIEKFADCAHDSRVVTTGLDPVVHAEIWQFM